MSDLEREFRELDEIDQQKAEATDEDLELDGIEEDLMATSVDEESDLSSLIDRKSELEAQLFGDADAPWNEIGDDIQPLRELVENISGMTGGKARPRLERLLRAVEELDPGQKKAGEGVPRKGRTPGARNVVAKRRRQLVAEFRSAWKEALSHSPVAAPAAPETAGIEEPDSTPSAGPAKPEGPPAGSQVPD